MEKVSDVLLNLNSIDRVRQFVNVVSKCEEDVDVFSFDLHYQVDGKSIMGIFSLDLSKPIVVRCTTLKDKNYLLANLDDSFTYKK